MGKLYYTDDICELIDNKLDRMSKGIIMNHCLAGEELLNEVSNFRTTQSVLYSFINDLREADDAYDAKMAAIRKAQEEKDGTDT